ncbi:hypothetical protein FLA_4839 [Filimonas lacunae]|nr:hypothetical protein FLA_4839 [Filimonas lacunae]
MYVLAMLLTQAKAQKVYYFDKGLAAAIPARYGREAIYTDELAYYLYVKALPTPVAGGAVGGSKDIVWEPVQADSLHILKRAREKRERAGGPPGPGVKSGTHAGGIGISGAYIYVTYSSEKEQTALLQVKGNSAVYVNGVIHAGDIYNAGYLYIPVQLNKGLNEFYIRGGAVSAALLWNSSPITVNTEDATLPSVRLSQNNQQLQGAIVVINASARTTKGLQLHTIINNRSYTSTLPDVPAMSTRKVPFTFDASGIQSKGKHNGNVVLTLQGKELDKKPFIIEAVNATDPYAATFTSAIDGSLQYYAVTPGTGGDAPGQALFFSVHGAGVEAIGQARAYKPKDWGNLVAPTNRRPRGFNWEDWGRLDALEVLAIAKKQFMPDEQHVYLTGHSMGGHGTWFLGATYPDKWAGIAPCSGYPTLKGYGSADGLIPDSGATAMEAMLLRTSNQSDVIKLANNYKPLGTYILHGDADKVVPVTYARQMRKLFGGFHTDMSYFEYPGGEHWYGDQSVDWKPLFEFFKWHARVADSAMHVIDFTTANPGVSAAYRWAVIQQQEHPLAYSRIQLKRDVAAGAITGSTENVQMLALQLQPWGKGRTITIQLDATAAITYTTASENDSVYITKDAAQWKVTGKPDSWQKGPVRNGTFKEPFNYRMVFVYSTAGAKEENAWSLNKAKYDAETWYYRGNGAIDIIADKEYSLDKYADRGVVLFGNAATNTAWKLLLKDCPVQVTRNEVKVGSRVLQGDSLAAYFTWPLKSSNHITVGAVSGTGLKGFSAANANQYFAGASGFPDYMVFGVDMLIKGSSGVKLAGFYNNQWQIADSESVITEVQ